MGIDWERIRATEIAGVCRDIETPPNAGRAPLLPGNPHSWANKTSPCSLDKLPETRHYFHGPYPTNYFSPRYPFTLVLPAHHHFPFPHFINHGLEVVESMFLKFGHLIFQYIKCTSPLEDLACEFFVCLFLFFFNFLNENTFLYDYYSLLINRCRLPQYHSEIIMNKLSLVVINFKNERLYTMKVVFHWSCL